MPKFRKKPVEVEAFQMTLEDMQFKDDWPLWLHDAFAMDRSMEGSLSDFEIEGDGVTKMVIKTLEGDHQVSPDDWIIQGVQGEIYPCKPDIFEATYERV
jgi:hypothetical protein